MNTKIHVIRFIGPILILAMLAISCQTSNTTKGGAIGATAGGAIGGLIGHETGNTAVGALIGAAVGGTAGALIGRRMDKQAEELQEDLEGATVQRVGEGILITFNEGLQFDVDSYELQPSSGDNLEELSDVLLKYEDTDILIEGHTDNTGDESYNQTLSEQRASTVKAYLIDEGVRANRISAIGYGEEQPLQDNSTQEGRQVNRRVEVAIYANEEMKEMAKEGKL